MVEKTIDQLLSQKPDVELIRGCIIYSIDTRRIYCLNPAGTRMLKKLEAGIETQRLTKRTDIKPFLSFLEKIHATDELDGTIKLRPGALRVYFYGPEDKYLDSPISVMLEVTPACDLKCIYCCVAELNDQEKGRILSVKEMESVVDEIAEYKVSSVTITGGEPFMRQQSHGDLFDIIHRLRSRQISVTMFTNGTLLSRYADQVLRSGISEITVSIDASTPQLFEQLTGRPYFDRVVEGLHAVADKGIFIRLAMVMTKLNFNDWRNMLTLVHELNLNALFLLRAYPIGRACKNLDYIIGEEEWKKISHEVSAFSQNRGYRTQGGRDLDSELIYPFGNCKAGTTFCIINYDGSISPCCGYKTLHIGQLRKDSFDKVWNGEKWRLFREKKFQCPVPDRDVMVIYNP